MPLRTVLGLAFVAFRCTGRSEGSLGCEVRLAEKGGLITRAGERASKAPLTDAAIEVDAVIPYPVRKREQSGQD
jgi:hypothetical protein